MSRISYAGARTGRRARTGTTGLIGTFEYEMGDRKRMIFPLIDESLVLLAKPYHPVETRGSIVLPKSNGQGHYAVDKVRCTHPYSQTSYEEGYKLAKTGDYCLFCQVALYEERQKWEELRKLYTKEEFATLSKEDKKAVFKEITAGHTVSSSYYTVTDADGNSYNSTHMDIYILALDLSVDPRGEVIMETVNGVTVPKFQPVLMPASKARLDKFKVAVDNSIMSGMLNRDMLHPYVEHPGTEMEEEVQIGWVDFLVTFPVKPHKMESGKDMGVMPMAQGGSVISAEFIEYFNQKAKIYETEAEKTFDRLYVNLQAHTPEIARSMFAAGPAYVDELASQYRVTEPQTADDGTVIPTDEQREQEVMASVIENYEKYLNEEEVEGDTGAVETGAVEQQPVVTTPQPETTVATEVNTTPPVNTAPPVDATPQPETTVATEVPTTTQAETVPPVAETQPQPPQLDDGIFDI